MTRAGMARREGRLNRHDERAGGARPLTKSDLHRGLLFQAVAIVAAVTALDLLL